MEEHHNHTSPPEPSLEDFERARALPPPAFPPGFRRVSVRRGLERRGPRGRARVRAIEDAYLAGEPFISPDEPIPHRQPRSGSHDDEDIDPDDVVVTGMGDDAHLEPEALGLMKDPDVVALTEQVVALAEGLRLRGEDSLREHPGMSRFEATLRAYCTGYLRGRRADEERS